MRTRRARWQRPGWRRERTFARLSVARPALCHPAPFRMICGPDQPRSWLLAGRAPKKCPPALVGGEEVKRPDTAIRPSLAREHRLHRLPVHLGPPAFEHVMSAVGIAGLVE